MALNRAVFLDRDGVLNAMVYRPDEGIYDSPYCLSEFHLLPGVSEAIVGIHRLGMLAIVVSNQPGVAKGKCDDATLDTITRHMCHELEGQAAWLDGIYYCLHHPEGIVAELTGCEEIARLYGCPGPSGRPYPACAVAGPVGAQFIAPPRFTAPGAQSIAPKHSIECPPAPRGAINRAPTFISSQALRANCDCRKPKPGLLLQAAQEHSIDLVHSYMIGDSPKDMEAGLAAGCRTIWVRGPNSGQMAPGVTPHVVTVDVLSAVREIEQGGS